MVRLKKSHIWYISGTSWKYYKLIRTGAKAVHAREFSVYTGIQQYKQTSSRLSQTFKKEDVKLILKVSAWHSCESRLCFKNKLPQKKNS